MMLRPRSQGPGFGPDEVYVPRPQKNPLDAAVGTASAASFQSSTATVRRLQQERRHTPIHDSALANRAAHAVAQDCPGAPATNGIKVITATYMGLRWLWLHL